MKNKKIILAGGTGFIGQEMIKYFGKENSIVVLTRGQKQVFNNRNRFDSLNAGDLVNTIHEKWDGVTQGEWVKQLDGADLLINLTGKSVNCRYTSKNKKEIFNSRTNAVKALGEAIRNCTVPPCLWINASSATIYRHSLDTAQDEFTGKIEDDFSVQVCKLWEKTFYDQSTPQTRKVALRMAITLGTGGVLIPYFNLLKFGLGGRQGSGKQMYSWVYVKDTCRMIEWLVKDHTLEGVFNCASPVPVTNKEFMKTLRKITHTSFGLAAPGWMLRLGGALIGTEAELVLKSRFVIPTKILQTGFEFQYPYLEEALKDIIKDVPRKQYQLF